MLNIVLSLLILFACNDEKEDLSDTKPANPTILEQLAENYQQLPEKEITMSSDYGVYAQYAKPTGKYDHGILGDKIEAEQLVVVADSIFYDLKLPEDYVFEDISPRLFDVDGDNELEFITIRTNINLGAGIVIYKIVNQKLMEYAHVPEIGKTHGWLNIVAINDLDNDGVVELVWIETPHIGGILKIAKIEAGTLQVISQAAQYSNHSIGERNLCLSVLTERLNKKVLYVPNQGKNKIVGFAFINKGFEIVEEISQTVDFSKPLSTQYGFNNIIENGNNCISGN